MPNPIKVNRAIKMAVLIAILCFAIFRSWLGTRHDSFANDEPFHIVSGAYYVAENDYRLNPEHPPLSKRWVGLWNQQLALRPMIVLDDKDHEREWLQEIMYFENDARESQQRSRWAMFSFHFILGLGIGLLIWRIFGFAWMVVSMLWLAIDPSIGAHQPVVLTDLPLSMSLLLSALTGGMFWYSGKLKWAAVFGISLGLAMAVKHSALPAISMLLLISAAFIVLPLIQKNKTLFRKQLTGTVLSLLMMFLTLWASYGFKGHSSVEGEDMFNRSLAQKIDDLSGGHWQWILSFMDDSGIIPKAYIWGLADTIRAGIEGRGDDEHMFFGEVVLGRSPALYFPASIATKVPIALLLIFAASVVLLILVFTGVKNKSLMKQYQWFVILALVAVLLAHLGILAFGRTSYGGIRHALPAVAMMGALAGGITLFRTDKFRNAGLALGLVLCCMAFLMTMNEKRVWEYFNEFAGGTENGFKCFCDEGIYLGQRFYEVEEFFNGEDIDKSLPIRTWGWYMNEEKLASDLNFRDGVVDIYDTTSRDRLEGYFLIEVCNYNPWPNWDPAFMDPLDSIGRIGNVVIAKGAIENERAWASGMIRKLVEHMMEEKNPDWETMVIRLEESTRIIDFSSVAFLLLGNAYLRTGESEKAMDAYKKSIENLHGDDPNKQKLYKQIDLISSTEDLSSLDVLRPFSVE